MQNENYIKECAECSMHKGAYERLLKEHNKWRKHMLEIDPEFVLSRDNINYPDFIFEEVYTDDPFKKFFEEIGVSVENFIDDDDDDDDDNPFKEFFEEIDKQSENLIGDGSLQNPYRLKDI